MLLGQLSQGILVVGGRATIGETTVDLQIWLPRHFPASLPIVFVVSPLPRRVPHVTNAGMVCYDRTAGLIIDRHNPARVVHQALDRALEMLETGLGGRNASDFVAEFKSVWRELAPEGQTQEVYSLVEPRGRVRWIRAVYGRLQSQKEEQLTGFLEEAGQLGRWGKPALFGNAPRLRRALFVPLRPKVSFQPPAPEGRWSSRQIRQFLEINLKKKERQTLRRLLATDPLAPVLLAVPRDAQSHALVAFEVPGAYLLHPLLGGRERIAPRFYTATRLDQTYLLPRGGASRGLASKHALIIGCGSLGSRIAELLAGSGIGKLTLVDPETLCTDNLYRHVLSAHHVGRSKVVGMQVELESRYLHLRVQTVAGDILETLDSGTVRLDAFDLIVAATGEPSVELELNRRFRAAHNAPPIVYSWLEVLGLGGHAVLTVSGARGCLECVYNPASHAEAPLYNRASFAAARQRRDYGRDLDGCGGAFTPFSALDAARTAELTVRMAVRTLEARTPQPRLESWRGDAERFTTAGFFVGDRYRVNADTLTLSGESFARADCPCCRVTS